MVRNSVTLYENDAMDVAMYLEDLINYIDTYDREHNADDAQKRWTKKCEERILELRDKIVTAVK